MLSSVTVTATTTSRWTSNTFCPPLFLLLYINKCHAYQHQKNSYYNNIYHKLPLPSLKYTSNPHSPPQDLSLCISDLWLPKNLVKASPSILTDIFHFLVNQAVCQKKYLHSYRFSYHILTHIIPHHQTLFRLNPQPFYYLPVIVGGWLTVYDILV